MRLTTNLLRAWVKDNAEWITDIENMYVSEGRITDMPDRQIGIQRVGGPEIIMEGAFEIITFRFEFRGRSNSLLDAEDIAVKMDTFLWGKNNFEIDNVSVTSISYGSPLRQLSLTDSQSRYMFSADYRFKASREG